jgi:hypothetical protein
MALGVVLLKEKFRKLTLDIVHNWDNNARVRTLIYCLPILLPKQALMPAIFPTYRPPKHPPDLSLVARVNAILIVYLFLPNFPYIQVRICLPGYVHVSSLQRILSHCSSVQSLYSLAQSSLFCLFSSERGGFLLLTRRT